ncbi:PST family polysaccharide transporter [Terracoccus luteus]|uniref:PST family polysaccharide transporter n=1 Tax=Terracoccus luteus TaxID=53356 RepID=A0A495Y161_9MICO|nr:lipopolysaccharide biosynthesis protein [Terracoccus luteus]RKT78493.1 PST family polysaccharide transporter [Terracoccus luteus]
MSHEVTPVAATEESLRAKVGRGFGWSVLNTVLSRAGSLLSGVLLARILAPGDYGVFAVALVVLTALLSLNELGVSLAVVRWPGDVGRIAPTVATLAAVTSGLLYVVAFVSAPWVASAMDAPSATPLIRLMSLCVLVDAVSAVPAALITREFRQRLRAGIDLAGFVGGTALTVVLALCGFGAWSLMWGFVASNVLVGAMCIARAPAWYGFGFDRSRLRELLAFGLPLAGSSAVLYLLVNLDYVVVGSVLGVTALGFYLLAFNVCSWPVNLVSGTMRRVTLAGFSRAAERPEGAAPVFTRAARLVVTLTLPMSVLLAVFADPLVRTVYGERWSPSAAPLRLLAVLAVARVLVELVYDFLVAVGRNSANLTLQSVWLVGTAVALPVGAWAAGITGVAAGHAVVAVAVMSPALLLVLRRSGVDLAVLGRACARPAAGAVVMAVVGLATALLPLPAWGVVLVGGALSSLAYAAVVLPVLREARQVLRPTAAA